MILISLVMSVICLNILALFFLVVQFIQLLVLIYFLWMSYIEQFLSGAKYLVPIVDDFSQTSWTYLMKCKTQTPYFIEQ